MPMTPRERLDAAFALKPPDRTPVLGGWIACPEHICTLTGRSLDEYWADPVGVSIAAYEVLGADGLITVFVPKGREDFRCVDADSYVHARGQMSLDEALRHVDEMPSAEEIEATFDLDAAYGTFRAELLAMQSRCGDMLWMPAQWGAGAQITWYGELGYENFFHVVGAYPDWARGRQRCQLVARAVGEGLYPGAMLFGEDICTQRGPLVSPRFMERHYAPQLRRGLEPLLEAGCRPVWHSDGDIRAIVDLLIDCGIQGFQGFQPECGLTLEYITQKRTRDGEPLVIFGPLAVTTELPVLSPAEIRARVRRAIEVCGENAQLVLFTSNTINPDVPLANIIAMHEAVREETG